MSTPENRSPIPSTGRASLRLRDQFLETNGLGGYTCATIGGARLWPSHGMVVIAKNPPMDRHVLINGFEVRVDTEDASLSLGAGGLIHPGQEPDGRKNLLRFRSQPWPRWTFDLGGGRLLMAECFCRQGTNRFVFRWHLEVSSRPVTLRVRPLLSGRPMHSPRAESHRINLEPECPSPRQFVWSLRPGAPALSILSDGEFHRQPEWIHGFAYDNDTSEDLACPGEFRWTLAPLQDAHLIAGTASEMNEDPRTANEVAHLAGKLRNAERTRRKLFRSKLDRAADQYIVTGPEGRTVISGYPRGTEMGARAMIAIRGICLSPGRLDVASQVLRTWRDRMASGLMPSEISEHRLASSFASPEPSLWYVVAVYEYLRAAHRQSRVIPAGERAELERSVEEILTGLSLRNHRVVFMDEDSLLAETLEPAGPDSPPRTIKRVTIQSLWLAALRIGDRLNEGRWETLYQTARREFDRAFWNEELGHLDHAILHSPSHPVERVSTLGLDQVLAVGGLPIVCVDQGKASLIVHALENAFAQAGMIQSATSLSWLFGAFIEAWYRIHHADPQSLEEVKRRFLAPWRHHLEFGGLDHLPEKPVGPSRSPDRDQARQTFFSAAETAELLRVLHLPDLRRNLDPFDDRLAPC